MKLKSRGFTLIELMIVVAIVAILAVLALPSFQSAIRKSRRSDAHAVLQAAQLAQEKFRLNNTTFAATADFGNPAFARVCVMSGSDCMSPSGYYVLTATGNDASGYTLTATATGTQAADTACSTITITQSATALTYDGTTAVCWSK